MFSMMYTYIYHMLIIILYMIMIITRKTSFRFYYTLLCPRALTLSLTNDLITHSLPLFVMLHGAVIRHPNFDFVAARFTDSFVHQPKLCKSRKERKKTDEQLMKGNAFSDIFG